MELKCLIADLSQENRTEKYDFNNIISEIEKYINQSSLKEGGLTFLKTGNGEDNLEDVIGTITGVVTENNKIYAIISVIEDSIAYKKIKPLIEAYGNNFIQTAIKGYWDEYADTQIKLNDIQSIELTVNKNI